MLKIAKKPASSDTGIFLIRVLTHTPGILILVISSVLFSAALFSFTLLLNDFHKGEVSRDWEKVDTLSWRTFLQFLGILAYKRGWLLQPATTQKRDPRIQLT